MNQIETLQYSVHVDDTLEMFNDILLARHFQCIIENRKHEQAGSIFDRVVSEENSNACHIITKTITSKNIEKNSDNRLFEKFDKIVLKIYLFKNDPSQTFLFGMVRFAWKTNVKTRSMYSKTTYRKLGT